MILSQHQLKQYSVQAHESVGVDDVGVEIGRSIVIDCWGIWPSVWIPSDVYTSLTINNIVSAESLQKHTQKKI